MKRKAPIEVSGLRKAPAIVVNRGDRIHDLTGWYEVVSYGPRDGYVVVKTVSVMDAEKTAFTIRWVHVDRIDEWRKG